MRWLLRCRTAAGIADMVEGLRWMITEDCDRYNRYYALVALRRLQDPVAMEVLMEALFAARLDPVTIDGNPA
jgi:hypothetical protein